MSGPRILLDEHVGRILEKLLRERGFDAVQAKDQFGERTKDAELLRWCADEAVVLLTNNAKDFEGLQQDYDHAGILLYYDQELPDTDPEGLARTIDEVFSQYGTEGVEDQLVDLDEWYAWLHD
ncbi:DUF5615 family PIN-like protein [Haloparvum sp. AD34]